MVYLVLPFKFKAIFNHLVSCVVTQIKAKEITDKGFQCLGSACLQLPSTQLLTMGFQGLGEGRKWYL